MHATGEARQLYSGLAGIVRVGKVRDASQCLPSSGFLANAAMLAHRQGYFLLDRTFALIESYGFLLHAEHIR
jgi:hypothetical protein